VVSRALTLSWLFVIGIVLLLLSISQDLAKNPGVAIVGTAMFGGWCGVCTSVIAAAFAESIWRGSRRRPARLRRWLHRAPLTTLLIVTIALLWCGPLPPWAPVVDMSGNEADPALAARPRDLETRWDYDRWFRIRNRSSDVRVVSLGRTNLTTQVDDLLLIWPGTHAEWVPSSVPGLYPVRWIDLDHEQANPCTYAVIRMNHQAVDGGSKLNIPNELLARELACRVVLSNGAIEYYDGSGIRVKGTVDSTNAGAWHSAHDLPMSRYSCTSYFSKDRLQQIIYMDMAILFDRFEGCWQ
jgi:hypothetical protein